MTHDERVVKHRARADELLRLARQNSNNHYGSTAALGALTEAVLALSVPPDEKEEP